jgi:glyoxylase-like metal-dependent hydrolase (beta-lactamase superfamily II)
MVKKWIAVAALAAAGVFVATVLVTVRLRADASSDVKAAVDKSLKAMGAQNVKTLVVSGDGFDTSVGQACNPHDAYWRMYADKNVVRSIDFDARGWRMTRTRGEGNPKGCGGAGTTNPALTADQNTVTMATPQAFNNYMEYVFLPEGFLKVALEKSDATVKPETVKGKKYTVISFTVDNGANKAPVKGYINDMGYVEKVQTMINIDPIGDAVWDAEYSGWKDFSGVMFPTHIVQHQYEPIFYELNVTDVKVNAPVDLTPPAGRGGGGGRGAAKGGDGKGAPGGPAAAKGGDGKGAPGGAPGGGRGGAQAVTDDDLGNGAWLITGGYGSVVVNFKNYIVVVEGPQNEMRAEQIITEAKKLVPNKPIKYVINTHAHFDHAGGLRPFVAEGATIVTSEGNKGYFEHIFKNPHTLVPDKLSQMKPQPKTKVEYVGESKKMTDGEHTIEIYKVDGSMHNDAMLMIYLPKQKVLIEADEFNVLNPIPTAPVPNPNKYQVNLLANIERLKLDVDRIIPIHLPNPADRKVTLTELKMAAGKGA